VKVYLDNASTGPVKKEVLKEILPYLAENFSAQGGPALGWGNPSSMHEWGRTARIAIDQARAQLAKFLNAEESEIIFTSGGTESDNLAIIGPINKIQETNSKQIQNSNNKDTKPHIITSQIEHHAVLNTCKDLEKKNIAEVTYLKPNEDGLISAEDVKKAIKENTVLVSVMYVNNEIGTIQPIREIGKMIEKINSERLSVSGRRIYFHTDAVQAAEYLEMNVLYLHVDLLTISGHKIGAPKGIGALYIKKGTPFSPMIHGGEQEFRKRSGTENVSGIVGIAEAIRQVESQKSKVCKVEELRNYFIDRILKEIPETELNGSKEFRSPNNVNIYFRYVEGESILMNLDLVGIAASSGSACTSLSLQPSHVIMAVYSDAERAHGSIRFTLGENTTKEEIDYTIKNLIEIITKLRKISPLAPKDYKN